MRFFLLRLTLPAPTGGGYTAPSDGQPLTVDITVPPAPIEWTSHPNGVYDPHYPNVIFDLQIMDYAVYPGAAPITIEGPSLANLQQADQFSPVTNKTTHKTTLETEYEFWNAELYAGMTADGLPLSTPAAGQPNPGMLMSGFVIQSFGNWVGTDMALSFLVGPSGKSQRNPGNLVLNAPVGTPMASAIAQMLNTAYPGVPQVIALSPNLVANHNITNASTTLQTMARFIQDATQGNNMGMPPSYPGASIYMQNGKIIVTDFTQKPNVVTQLSLESLIGQPTWVTTDTMQIMTVLRADIEVGQAVKLPAFLTDLPGFVTTQPAITNAYQNYQLAFKGQFIVTKLRHIGESRGASGMDWMTIIEAVPTNGVG